MVPTLDGRALLERLLARLGATTDYDEFDVLVVDNGSADGTVDWLRTAALPFPLRVVAMERNLSFSEACNAGAAATDGELLLFLNNDVEPIEPGWLKRLVTSLEGSRAAVAGAVLLDPALESEGGRQGAVHHRDLYFRPAPRLQGVLEPRPRGFGADLATALGPDRPAAAVTAACALVRRSAFDSVQGFSEAFFYGKEDVDLCLKLAAAGHGVVASGTTVLVHRRGATRRASRFGTGEAMRDNLRVLIERWGPRLRREYALDHESGRGVWSDGSAARGRWDASVAYCVVGDPEGAASARERSARARARGAHLDRRARLAARRRDRPRRLQRHAAAHRPWALERAGAHRRPPAAAARTGPLRRRLRARGRRRPARGRGRGRDGAPRRRTARPPGGAAESGPAAGDPRARDGADGHVGDDPAAQPLRRGGRPGGEPDATQPRRQREGLLRALPLDADQRRAAAAARRDVARAARVEPRLGAGSAFDDLREEARGLIAEDFATTARAWTFKDPRTSLTLPFWRPLLGDVDYVICHRQPLDVAASLERRDGLALEQSLALWERYMAASILQTTGARRLFIGYDEYFDARDGALAALTAFAGAPALAGDEAFRAQAATWLDVDMRHHHRMHRELLAEPQAGRGVVRLHLLLELAVRSRDREPALAGARGGGPISDALDAVARESLGTAAVAPLSAADRPA